METLGIILAGGNSSRMGGDKALLPIHGMTLLEHTTAVVRDCLQTVWISRRQDQPLPAGSDRTVYDSISDAGPLAGIAAALQAALTDGRFNGMLIVPVDLPLLTADTLRPLLQEGRRLQQPVCYGRNFMPLYLPVRSEILEFIQQQLNDADSRRSVASVFFPFHGIQLAEPGGNALTNTNTQAEWQAALETGPGVAHGQDFH
ncbi:MAG: molybdenum cofactor guanylyltransferase [Pseudomonadota bacterium]|nr:molybdenum cofactor guanylyltransferase [Pseudomonadota bacterium]